MCFLLICPYMDIDIYIYIYIYIHIWTNEQKTHEQIVNVSRITIVVFRFNGRARYRNMSYFSSI